MGAVSSCHKDLNLPAPSCCARSDEDSKSLASQFRPEWAPSTKQAVDSELLEVAPWEDDGRQGAERGGWEEATEEISGSKDMARNAALRGRGKPIQRPAATAPAPLGRPQQAAAVAGRPQSQQYTAVVVSRPGQPVPFAAGSSNVAVSASRAAQVRSHAVPLQSDSATAAPYSSLKEYVRVGAARLEQPAARGQQEAAQSVCMSKEAAQVVCVPPATVSEGGKDLTSLCSGISAAQMATNTIAFAAAAAKADVQAADKRLAARSMSPTRPKPKLPPLPLHKLPREPILNDTDGPYGEKATAGLSRLTEEDESIGASLYPL
eukprot:TRINITY_DN101678_c0_g1_i1.p1 TRINITY_DN101678_c0_g1~~TRINITY_DN101678_c0_g1_i1.p1  ORF type:complete len:320 (-),score=35.92 TRINITY_DN101678_c0_g1_i1:235-1194(-)